MKFLQVSYRDIYIFIAGGVSVSLLIMVLHLDKASTTTTSRTTRVLSTTPAMPTMQEVYSQYNHPEGLHHWLEYGEHYERNLAPLRSKFLANDGAVLNMLEIGVQSGGSINVWKDYFGSMLRYTGADINPKCTRFENKADHVSIEIGDQSDNDFLSELCNQYGPFDLIIDDGSHTTAHILPSLLSLWGCLNNDAVYAIEDLHTMSMWKGGKGMVVNGQDFYDTLGGILRDTSAYFTQRHKGLYFSPDVKTHHFSGHIKYAYASDSLVFFHYTKELLEPMHVFKKGSNWIPY
jgi:hypothetical protein